MRIALAALMYLAATAANAEGDTRAYYTGNDLFARCRDNPNAAAVYVMGVADATSFIRAVLPNARMCVPIEVTGGQAKDIVCKALAQKPEARHQAAAGLTMEALDAAFPCPRP